MGPGNNLVSAFAANLIDTKIAVTGIRAATLSLNSDGTASYSGTASPSAGPPNGTAAWLTTTGAGLGSGYWARITIATSALTTYSGTMTPGTWYPLSSTQGFTAQNSASNTEGTGTFSIDFSQDGGSSITKSFTGSNWDVGYTP